MNRSDDSPNETVVPHDAPANRAEVPYDDPRVIDALEEYVSAVPAGDKPNRQEFLGRHPDIASVLAKGLDGLELVQMAADQMRKSAAAHPRRHGSKVPPGTILGNFQIIREIGRGGMGVVYEATQRSLGRRVALKVLSYAAMMDSKQLERFKIEAQAAARLHHPNIVPVFACDSERDVHYFAMQYIDGQTLAEAIRELRMTHGLDPGRGVPTVASEPPRSRQSLLAGREPAESPTLPTSDSRPPTAAAASPAAEPRPRATFSDALSVERSTNMRAYFRTIARLGIQAADALEHVHQVSIVHRDIKPSNLLVEAGGNLWIADFGLARVGAHANLTVTGDVVGTLRYMSPEQARGKPALVDRRTDIYSLAVTLYELLTLEPAFAAGDPHELLRQVAADEPRAPRQVDKAIPPELETVLLKAMAKDPADRYATAGEFGDDLRRFLEHRPVLAKPATPWQRLMKLGYRYRQLVAAAVIGAVFALALTVVWIWRAWARADENALAARAAEKSARGQRDLALEVIYDLISKAQQLAGHPGTQELRRDLLKTAVAGLDRVARSPESAPLIDTGTVEAHLRMGNVLLELGDTAEARQQYEQGRAIAQVLAAADPRTARAKAQLARAIIGLGDVGQRSRDNEAARHYYEEALRLFKGLDSAEPQNRAYVEGLIETYDKLGDLSLHGFGNPAAAEVHYRTQLNLAEAVAEAEPADAAAKHSVAAAYSKLGEMYEWVYHAARTGKDQQAALGFAGQDLAERTRAYFQRAVAFEQEAAALEPTSTQYQRALALSCQSLGCASLVAGDANAARDNYRKSLPLLQTLADAEPKNAQAQQNLAETYFRLGDVSRFAGELDAARDYYLQTLSALEKAPSDPENARAKLDRSVVYDTIAWFFATTREQRLHDPAVAVELASRSNELFPSFPLYWRTLGAAHYRAGDWRAALAAFERSVQLSRGGSGTDWLFLAMAHHQLDHAEESRVSYDRAMAWMQQHEPNGEELQRFHDEAAALLGLND